MARMEGVVMQSRRLRPGAARNVSVLLAGASLLASASAAQANVTFTPRVDARAIFSDSVGGGDDSGVITVLAPGFSLKADSRRVKAQADYEFSRRFAIDGDLSEKHRHKLSARVQSELVRDFLFLNAGGVVTQVMRDLRGAVSADPDADNNNLSTVSSFYVSPSFKQDVGSLVNVSGSYRFSYTNLDDPSNFYRESGENFSLARASDSYNHAATLTIANRNPSSRLQWAIRNNFSRDEREDLNEFLRTYTSVLDIDYALNRKIHLLGSIGYEDRLDRQDNILTDSTTGLPVLDSDGRLQIDPAQPRRTVFDRSGLTWDVGVKLTPSRRTELTVRGGRQFGDTVFSGSLAFQVREGLKITGSYKESLDTFGNLFSGELDGQSFAFMVNENYRVGPALITVPTENGYAIVAGSINNATFRSRRAQVQVSYQRGRNTLTMLGYYDRRTFLDIGRTGDSSTPAPDPTATGNDDKTWGGSLVFRRQLGQRQSLSVDASYQNSTYALSRSRQDDFIGGGISYRMDLSDKLTASISARTIHRISNTTGADDQSNSVTLGVRASF